MDKLNISKGSNDAIDITNGENKLSISYFDEKFIFSFSGFDSSLSINKYSFDDRPLYSIFEKFICYVVGRKYIDRNEYHPQDFINMDEKTITLHCDFGTGNSIRFKIYDNDSIDISITHEEKKVAQPSVPYHLKNSVIIYKDCEYNKYADVINDLYQNLSTLADRLNYKVNSSDREPSFTKRKSFFDKLRDKKHDKK